MGSKRGCPSFQLRDWEGGGARAETENVGEAGLGWGSIMMTFVFHVGISTQTDFLLRTCQRATLLLDKWDSSSAYLLGLV